jgi:hypothetical protein
MAVPFPSPTFPSGFTPYALKAFVDPAGSTSAKSAWLVATPPANAFWFDQNALRPHVGSAISVSANTLNITAGGAAKTFDLSGDGTGRIPVGIIDP